MLVEGRDLLSDYDAIRRELERYRPELLQRKEIIVLSKADLIHDDALIADLESKLSERGLQARRISAAATQGLDSLLLETFDAVDKAREEDAAREQESAANTRGHR
jgi:GTP-binding protein